MSLLDLTGRTALVTGASRGIGEACARALANAGARVALAARSQDLLEALAKELPNDPVVLAADLSQPGAPTTLAQQAIESLGHVDVLVNNAGISGVGPAPTLREDIVDKLLAINVRAPMMLAAAIGTHMAERGSGSIVNMSSGAGVAGSPWFTAYAATKAALDAITRCLSAELGEKGVRVNGVAPGIIHTDMWDAGLKIPGIRERLEDFTPLRRVGTADEVADVVLFLASDAARFVTGETIAIDGGAIGSKFVFPRQA